MCPRHLATYDACCQHREPITRQLQARRAPTLVAEVMPQAELVRAAGGSPTWGGRVRLFPGGARRTAPAPAGYFSGAGAGEGPTGEGPTGEGPTGEGPMDVPPSGEGPTGGAPSGDGPTAGDPSGDGPTGPMPEGPMPEGPISEAPDPEGPAPDGRDAAAPEDPVAGPVSPGPGAAL